MSDRNRPNLMFAPLLVMTSGLIVMSANMNRYSGITSVHEIETPEFMGPFHWQNGPNLSATFVDYDQYDSKGRQCASLYGSKYVGYHAFGDSMDYPTKDFSTEAEAIAYADQACWNGTETHYEVEGDSK